MLNRGDTLCRIILGLLLYPALLACIFILSTELIAADETPLRPGVAALILALTCFLGWVATRILFRRTRVHLRALNRQVPGSSAYVDRAFTYFRSRTLTLILSAFAFLTMGVVGTTHKVLAIFQASNLGPWDEWIKLASVVLSFVATWALYRNELTLLRWIRDAHLSDDHYRLPALLTLALGHGSGDEVARKIVHDLERLGIEAPRPEP